MTGRLARAAFALQIAALWAVAWIPGAARLPVPALALWAVAFAAYAFAAGRADALSRRQLWAGGVLARLGLLPLAPRLSEDIYRYLWDGWVQRNGVNPFVHPPGDEALSELRLDWWSMINHPDVSTIYPPGAQLAFFALAWSGPALWVFKLLWLAADLGVARLIERLARGGSRVPLFLWLASPLLIV
ncbi:MAG: hypothetical protein R3266_10030, partial [Gemmatimonadota bacterium]|nr:hypothetical protein [Gemmatimonadota bacterium]